MAKPKGIDKNCKRTRRRMRLNPLSAASQAKGNVLENILVDDSQRKSSIDECVRVTLIKNGKEITVFMPRDDGLNFIEGNEDNLVAGFGRKGCPSDKARYKIVKVANVSLLALYKAKKQELRS